MSAKEEMEVFEERIGVSTHSVRPGGALRQHRLQSHALDQPRTALGAFVLPVRQVSFTGHQYSCPNPLRYALIGVQRNCKGKLSFSIKSFSTVPSREKPGAGSTCRPA